MDGNLSITLIIPCYNEGANIQKGVLDKIGNFTKGDERFKEVFIVDDGSTDESKKLITAEYLHSFPKFKLIENTHQGKAYAIITGIKEAKTTHVIFSDIDLATPIEESEKLIQKVKNEYHIVIGSRSSQRQGAPLLRRIMSHGAIYVKNIILGLHNLKDTQCGFKLFERKAALNIINRLQVFRPNHQAKGSSVSAGFDLEFLYIATKLKYKISEVTVSWQHVETKNVNFINDSIESLKDILKIKYYSLTNKYELGP